MTITNEEQFLVSSGVTVKRSIFTKGVIFAGSTDVASFLKVGLAQRLYSVNGCVNSWDQPYFDDIPFYTIKINISFFYTPPHS